MRGAIFSLDAALAIFVAVLLLGYAAFYTSRAEDPSFIKQMERTGYDLASIMYQQGFFDTLDNSTLDATLAAITPAAYLMKLNLSGTFTGSPITTNNTLERNDTIITGTFPISMYNSSSGLRFYGSVRFWIWAR